MRFAFAVLAVLASLIGVFDFVRRARTRRNIAPAAELQRRFGLWRENRPVIRLNPTMVPPHLRDLVPLAEKWGIGDDIIRHDFIENATSSEKQELHDALYESFEGITEWLNSLAGGSLSKEAEAFMYMQGALDEMGIFILEEKRISAEPRR